MGLGGILGRKCVIRLPSEYSLSKWYINLYCIEFSANFKGLCARSVPSKHQEKRILKWGGRGKNLLVFFIATTGTVATASNTTAFTTRSTNTTRSSGDGTGCRMYARRNGVG